MQYKHYKIHWLCVTSIAVWQAIEAERKRGIKSWKYIKGMEGGGARCILVLPYFPFQPFPYNYCLPQRQRIHSFQFNTNAKMFMENTKKHMLLHHRTINTIFLTQARRLELHMHAHETWLYLWDNKYIADWFKHIYI